MRMLGLLLFYFAQFMACYVVGYQHGRRDAQRAADCDAQEGA